MDEKLQQLIETLNNCFPKSEFTDCSFTETLERLCNAVEKLTYQTELQNQIVSDFLLENITDYKEKRNYGETDIEKTIENLINKKIQK